MQDSVRSGYPPSLAGRRIVVVEDESFIALDIEDALEEAGATVAGRAATVARAIELIERTRPDAVTLDGNLGGEMSGPVARLLEELGIPFIVLTGYVEKTLADPDLARAPRITKPFSSNGLLEALAARLV